MGISEESLFQGVNVAVWEITATADGDTTYTFDHGLSALPRFKFLVNVLQAPAALSGWAIEGLSDTQVTVVKGTAVGSGDANPQVRLTLALRDISTWG